MEEPSRRSFLSGSLATIAGLTYGLRDGAVAGRPPRAGVDPGTLPGKNALDLDGVFDLVPAGSAVDREYQVVLLADVSDVDTAEELTYQTREVVESVDGLETAAVTRVVSARTDPPGLLGGAVGSFEGLDPGERVGSDGDWRVADTGEFAVASTDGQLAFAGGDSEGRVTAVETAVTAARGETDTLLDTTAHAAEAFGRLADNRLAFLLRSVDGGILQLAEAVEAVGAGFSQDPNEFEGEVDNEYLLFTSRRLDDERAGRVVRQLDPGRVVDLELSREEGLIHATVVSTQPPSRDSEAAPDARIQATRADGSGLLSFEHVGGEPVPAGKLELWVDGERPSTQPSDEVETFADGDSFAVEVDTLATVTLRWFDEEQNVYHDYVRRLLGEDAFETEYDVDGERLQLTYTGDRAADPSKLTLRHRGEDGDQPPDEGFGDTGELTPGDVVTVEGVEMGDRVTVSLDVPARPRGAPTTLARFRAAPPRLHAYQAGEGVVLRYHGDTERDAAEFDLLVDGEAANQQFADEYATLERGDELLLETPPLGSEVTVEWTEPDEPVEVAQLRVVPQSHVETTYDDGRGAVELGYREGPALAADALSLTVDGDPAPVQPADEGGQFTPGDTLTVEASPFSVVELVWESGELTHELEEAVTGRDAIEASYDPDEAAVEFVYVGGQPASPGRLDVVRGRRQSQRGADGTETTAFEAEHDTLTEGDSIRVTDVDVDGRLSVVLAVDERRRPLLDFTPRPQWPFSFEQRDGELVAVYSGQGERDAESFRLLVGGDPADTQPADVHDTLERGDEVELGTVAAGTEVTAEWVVPAEPQEVRTHVVTPDVGFTVELSSSGETVTVEHDGGGAVDAGDLSVVVHSDRGERVRDSWGESGTEVTAGDTTTVAVPGESDEGRVHVGVVYGDGELLDSREFELSDGAD